MSPREKQITTQLLIEKIERLSGKKVIFEQQELPIYTGRINDKLKRAFEKIGEAEVTLSSIYSIAKGKNPFGARAEDSYLKKLGKAEALIELLKDMTSEITLFKFESKKK